ncbi:L-Ala-D/L-Glu epimerase [Mangrovibacter yixingensis]|uniref:L-Ala-D/L-Glu epimerase n=1 Tax=Mangrovibacter yixingensis TaxID=1529639 RepID=UPI001CF95D80|nr:L-Ala-D/L-Glu epimerase [Mangrovibacter yixingensis]
MRNVSVYEESWPLNTPFTIARGTREQAIVVVVEIEDAGIKAVGECTPYLRYGETAASVMAQITTVIPALQQGLSRHELQVALPPGAARNAVDCALWNLEACLAGLTLPQYLRTPLPESVVMAQTVVIDTPERMAQAARRLWLGGAHLLKIKLDDRLITERMVAIRTAVPEATLIVDANESWHVEGLAARCQLLADLNVAMLEQPLPAAEDSALAHFVHPLPICADESCHTRSQLGELLHRYEMVNIKLDKAGGLTEALALQQAAISAGFEIMLGCMLCTSRAITAALPLTPAARFLDLDGPSWLAVDVEPGLNFTPGMLHL